MRLLDRHEQPVHVCLDPACPWAALPDGRHFDRHNPRCAELCVGHDSTEVLCELAQGHSGPHRGTTRHPDR